MATSFQVLLISGSTREPSHTRTLTEKIEQVLTEHQAKTVHWNLRERPLPIADPRFHDDPNQHPDDRVHRLVESASSCDAFVLASPIYHNSYSGVIKNALDHLAIPQFYYKPVGLASHGGNRSSQAVDHLRIVVRGLLGTAIPSQVCTASDDYSETDSEYQLTSEDILIRIERFATELLTFAFQLQLIRKAIERG